MAFPDSEFDVMENNPGDNVVEPSKEGEEQFGGQFEAGVK